MGYSNLGGAVRKNGGAGRKKLMGLLLFEQVRRNCLNQFHKYTFTFCTSKSNMKSC